MNKINLEQVNFSSYRICRVVLATTGIKTFIEKNKVFHFRQRWKQMAAEITTFEDKTGITQLAQGTYETAVEEGMLDDFLALAAA